MSQGLTAQEMFRALKALDRKLPTSVTLLVGGGSAMILAHGFPLATVDIDAYPRGMELAEFDKYVKQVAQELKLVPDWLNPYFSTFSHTLPSDYSERLIEVFRGKWLVAQALGKEEMLLMKCFAHRQKDVGHAKALIKKGANVQQVENQIESLKRQRIPGAEQAMEFLGDVLDQLEE